MYYLGEALLDSLLKGAILLLLLVSGRVVVETLKSQSLFDNVRSGLVLELVLELGFFSPHPLTVQNPL